MKRTGVILCLCWLTLFAYAQAFPGFLNPSFEIDGTSDVSLTGNSNGILNGQVTGRLEWIDGWYDPTYAFMQRLLELFLICNIA